MEQVSWPKQITVLSGWAGAVPAILEAAGGLLLVIFGLSLCSLWLLYRFAEIILLAAGTVLAILAILALVVHWVSQTTIVPRCQRRLEAFRDQLRRLEAIGATAAGPEAQALGLRVREAHQALVNAYERRLRKFQHRRKRPVLWRRTNSAAEHTLVRQLDELIQGHQVVPQTAFWDRLVTLHLQSAWVEWTLAHPKKAIVVGQLGFLTLVLITISLQQGG